MTKREKTFPIKTFRIGSYPVSLKNTFEFYELEKAADDTLRIQICSDNLFSPFGVIRDTNQFANSQFKNYLLDNTVGVGDDEKTIQSVVMKDSSRLAFYFFHTNESAPHSYIIQGVVYDTAIHIFKTVRVGMKKEDFYKTFFNTFPAELMEKFRFVVFETCVFGIRETFRFRNNKLASARFRCRNCVGVGKKEQY